MSTAPDLATDSADIRSTVPDPEVPERATRRKYSARYKARTVAEYDRLDATGRGAWSRREACPPRISRSGASCATRGRGWARRSLGTSMLAEPLSAQVRIEMMDHPYFKQDPQVPPRVPRALRLDRGGRAFCQHFFGWSRYVGNRRAS